LPSGAKSQKSHMPFLLGVAMNHNLLRTIVAAIACLILVSPAAAIDSAVEQRIAHIQSGLLPPVLVKGEPADAPSLSARMEALHVPGVSIAYIHAGKIEWARGFGHTKIVGPPVTPDTLFQAASISKPVTALAIMHLVQVGKLDLDTDVNRYLKTWKVPDNEFTRQTPVTLRELLTHSAGITVHGFAGYEAGAALPTLVEVLNGEKPANNDPIRVDIVPGKTWRYSGGGYEIAQQVVMDVTGVPFPKIMQDVVLKPLGMNHSTYQQPLPPNLLAQAATPYRADGTPVTGGPHVYPELAAAALWTTPSDLARYAIGVQQALSGKSERLLNVATTKLMLTPVIERQAIGPGIGGSSAQPDFSHGGANDGYRCMFVAYENGDGVVVMTNSDRGDVLTAEIVRTIAHEYGWPDYAPPERVLSAIDPASFDRYVGAYRFASGATVTFWRDGNHFTSRIWGQPVADIFPTSEREYFVKVVDARWVFSSGASESTQAILYQNNQEQIVTQLNGPEGRAALELSIATEKRFKEQKATPGTEAALRRLIEAVAAGKPNYDEMTPKFAETIRPLASELEKTLKDLGPLQSLTFTDVRPAGSDAYDAKFENATRKITIRLDADGKIDTSVLWP
jgi:CubicO group peptidase (beta-lactamase class C family)